HRRGLRALPHPARFHRPHAARTCRPGARVRIFRNRAPATWLRPEHAVLIHVKTVYLALGANIGERARNLERALDALEAEGVHIVRRSSLYETEPRDVRDQPWFLNLVVEAETILLPRQLLSTIRRIEKNLGRKRVIAKGPRTIDIDILLFGRFVVDTPELQIPHPRLHERRFVLEPLAELAPELRHPITHRSAREMLGDVMDQQVRRVVTAP